MRRLLYILVPLVGFYAGPMLGTVADGVFYRHLRQQTGRDLGVTYRAYEGLTTRMSLDNAREVIGAPGREVRSVGGLQLFVWADGNRQIRGTFYRGELVAREQQGL